MQNADNQNNVPWQFEPGVDFSCYADSKERPGSVSITIKTDSNGDHQADQQFRINIGRMPDWYANLPFTTDYLYTAHVKALGDSTDNTPRGVTLSDREIDRLTRIIADCEMSEYEERELSHAPNFPSAKSNPRSR